MQKCEVDSGLEIFIFREHLAFMRYSYPYNARETLKQTVLNLKQLLQRPNGSVKKYLR